MTNKKFLEKIIKIAEAGIEIEKHGKDATHGIKNLERYVDKHLYGNRSEEYQTVYKAFMNSPEWRAWENHLTEKMKRDEFVPGEMFDFDETRECGWMSDKHMRAFMRFVRSNQ